ncbi:MAG: hypothetical protein ACQEP9_07480, partial [Bacillota bacterium]
EENEENEENEELKSVEVLNEEGIFKIKLNQNIDQEMIDSINETVEGLFVINPLEIEFDLTGVDFKSEDIKEEFNKIKQKIEAVGGQVRKINDF